MFVCVHNLLMIHIVSHYLACGDGNYGVNCTETCGHCLHDDTCNFETGSCPRGCAVGWKDHVCKTGKSTSLYLFNELLFK